MYMLEVPKFIWILGIILNLEKIQFCGKIFGNLHLTDKNTLNV